MKTEGQTTDIARGGFVMGLLTITGVAAIIGALVIAWPALSFLITRQA